MINLINLFTGRLINKLQRLYKVRELPKIFQKEKMKNIIKYNRETLKKVKNWIDDDVYEKSIYQYGLPIQAKQLINVDMGRNITYTDAILYLSSCLKKEINYLELGVSVGKNFFQIANFIEHSKLTGFDIEKINPILESFFQKKDHIEWATLKESKKQEKSSLTTYYYAKRNNEISYLSGDIFDENSWKRLSGNKYNLFYSDAFHTPDALIYEYEMITKYLLIDDEEFILVWDDLHEEMEKSFDKIWHKLQKKYNLKENNRLRIGLNGWLGQNEFIHEIGIIYKI